MKLKWSFWLKLKGSFKRNYDFLNFKILNTNEWKLNGIAIKLRALKSSQICEVKSPLKNHVGNPRINEPVFQRILVNICIIQKKFQKVLEDLKNIKKRPELLTLLLFDIIM